MSVDATRWVWQQRDITPTQKLVLLSMADRAGENHDCWPSVARLCLDTGFSDRAVQNTIKALVEKGLVRIEERRSKTNKYTLVGVSGREDGVKNAEKPIAHTSPVDGGEPRSPRSTFTPNNIHPERRSRTPRTSFGEGVNHVHPNLKETQRESSTHTRGGPESPARGKMPNATYASAAQVLGSTTSYIPSHEMELSPEQLENNRSAARRVRDARQKAMQGQ